MTVALLVLLAALTVTVTIRLARVAPVDELIDDLIAANRATYRPGMEAPDRRYARRD